MVEMLVGEMLFASYEKNKHPHMTERLQELDE
jgi:hypothetical protein